MVAFYTYISEKYKVNGQWAPAGIFAVIMMSLLICLLSWMLYKSCKQRRELIRNEPYDIMHNAEFVMPDDDEDVELDEGEDE